MNKLGPSIKYRRLELPLYVDFSKVLCMWCFFCQCDTISPSHQKNSKPSFFKNHLIEQLQLLLKYIVSKIGAEDLMSFQLESHMIA